MRKLILYTFIMLVGLPSALARGVFAMDQAGAEMYMPAVLNVLSGKTAAETPGNTESGILTPYALDPKTGERYDCFQVRDWSVVYVGFESAPKGSIAVIPITDAIMKYDYCGAYGTISYLQFLTDAERSPNIIGTLLSMDTPGGEVYGTKNLSDAIANASKPVVSHINDGYCASAGVYIAAPSNRILLAQPSDKIGSVGAYTTLIDVRGAYEKEGYKLITVYSPTSPEKNKAWREAFENDNIKPVEKDIQFLDNIFMKQVTANRSNLNKEVLDGGMFYAEEAIDKGLADGMASFEQAIEEVINLGKRSITI
jgi:protease-4